MRAFHHMRVGFPTQNLDLETHSSKQVQKVYVDLRFHHTCFRTECLFLGFIAALAWYPILVPEKGSRRCLQLGSLGIMSNNDPPNPCPSFEAGMNAVAMQGLQNPNGTSLDQAIAVSRSHLPFLLGFLGHIPWSPTHILILDSEAATARLADLQAQMGHLSGMSSVSPQSGVGLVISEMKRHHFLVYDGLCIFQFPLCSGVGFSLPQAAGAFVPGFGLTPNPLTQLTRSASHMSVATSVAPSPPVTPSSKQLFSPQTIAPAVPGKTPEQEREEILRAKNTRTWRNSSWFTGKTIDWNCSRQFGSARIPKHGDSCPNSHATWQSVGDGRNPSKQPAHWDRKRKKETPSPPKGVTVASGSQVGVAVKTQQEDSEAKSSNTPKSSTGEKVPIEPI